MRRLPFVLLFLAFTRLAAAEPVLRVVAPDKTLALTAEEFAALPDTELAVTDPHSQARLRISGVAVRELIERAGAPIGEKLRGPALQLGVVVRVRDGYAVLFSLADFDAAFSTRTFLLADRIDGQPLPEKSAPFQLIVPDDKRAARWVRMVTSLEIVAVPATAPAEPRPRHDALP